MVASLTRSAYNGGAFDNISDLLNIESGLLDQVKEKYEIINLVNDTSQFNILRIGRKKIEFELYVDENMPARLLGDELRIKQIMNNILYNAFKYTKAGSVTLTVTAVDNLGSEEEVTLYISVSDTGKGMTQEQVNKLFETSPIIDEDDIFITEVTGMNMKTTIKLIQMMNGQMTVVSKPENGSNFIVRIPQGRIDRDILGKESVKKLHKTHVCNITNLRKSLITQEPMPYGKILIVDDISTNIFVARGLLNPYELKIDAALSGIEAIRKIREGNIYDIIFMDHMMPGMDGIETTKRIRDLGYDRPIVALTANAVIGQTGKFLENGFDDYISKPVDVWRLNQLLNNLVRDKHLSKK